jgi:hypothetical protein
MKYKQLKNKEFPLNEKPVIGFDERSQKEVIVCYRADSNRFFEHPYTGSFYPLDVMNKWRVK